MSNDQGVSSRKGDCQTCGQNMDKCNGHFGHIRLALPTFHIGYLKVVMNILQNICKVRAALTHDHSLRAELQ